MAASFPLGIFQQGSDGVVVDLREGVGLGYQLDHTRDLLED
jgi:hypothetical protein